MTRRGSGRLPLDGPFPIGLDVERGFSTLSAAGPACGDGGTMRQVFDLTLNPDVPAPVARLQQDFSMFVVDFLGARPRFYGGRSGSVTWSVVR